MLNWAKTWLRNTSLQGIKPIWWHTVSISDSRIDFWVDTDWDANFFVQLSSRVFDVFQFLPWLHVETINVGLNSHFDFFWSLSQTRKDDRQRGIHSDLLNPGDFSARYTRECQLSLSRFIRWSLGYCETILFTSFELANLYLWGTQSSEDI